MKRTMNTTVVVVCALVIALFTTSCSKDNDIPDAEKNAIQALNNITGNYKVTWLLLMGQQQQSGRESIGL